MSGPPPAYEEHEKYPTNRPEYTASFQTIPSPGSPRAILRPPGHDIYGQPSYTSPPTHIRSHHECHGAPVYQYRNSIITQPPALTPEQLIRRRRVIVGSVVFVFLMPLVIFLIVMICTVWAR